MGGNQYTAKDLTLRMMSMGAPVPIAFLSQWHRHWYWYFDRISVIFLVFSTWILHPT